jgi:hypothetical protein
MACAYPAVWPWAPWDIWTPAMPDIDVVSQMPHTPTRTRDQSERVTPELYGASKAPPVSASGSFGRILTGNVPSATQESERHYCDPPFCRTLSN